jgi:hypothetical protein
MVVQEVLLSIYDNSYFFETGVGFHKRAYQQDNNYLSSFGLSEGLSLGQSFVIGARLNWSMDWQPDFKNYLNGIEYLESNVGLFTVTDLFQ